MRAHPVVAPVVLRGALAPCSTAAEQAANDPQPRVGTKRGRRPAARGRPC
jgi:hypothetical protein